MSRRAFLKTVAGLLVAPWVVKAENIMRVRPLGDPFGKIFITVYPGVMLYPPPGWTAEGWVRMCDGHIEHFAISNPHDRPAVFYTGGEPGPARREHFRVIREAVARDPNIHREFLPARDPRVKRHV